MFRPKALSARSTVWRFGSSSSAVRREERAGGISERSRDVKMSSNFAVCSVFFVRRTEASVSQAGAPRVLPPRWISVTLSEAMRGFKWGSMSSAVSSLRERPERVNVVGDSIVLGFAMLDGIESSGTQCT